MAYRFTPIASFVPGIVAPRSAGGMEYWAGTRDEKRIKMAQEEQAWRQEQAKLAAEVEAQAARATAENDAYERQWKLAKEQQRIAEAAAAAMRAGNEKALPAELAGNPDIAEGIRSQYGNFPNVFATPGMVPSLGVPGFAREEGNPMPTPAPQAEPAPTMDDVLASAPTGGMGAVDNLFEGAANDEDLLQQDLQGAATEQGPETTTQRDEVARPDPMQDPTIRAAIQRRAGRLTQAGQERWTMTAEEAATSRRRTAAAAVAQAYPVLMQEAEGDPVKAEKAANEMFKRLGGEMKPGGGGKGGKKGAGDGVDPNFDYDKFIKADTRMASDQSSKVFEKKARQFADIDAAHRMIEKHGDNPAVLAGVIFRYAKALQGAGVLSDSDVKRAFNGVEGVDSLIAQGEQFIQSQIGNAKAGELVRNLAGAIASQRKELAQEIRGFEKSETDSMAYVGGLSPDLKANYVPAQQKRLDKIMAPVRKSLDEIDSRSEAADAALEEMGL